MLTPVRSPKFLLLAAVVMTGVGLSWTVYHSAVLAQALPSGPPAADLRRARIVLRHEGEKLAEVYAARVQISRDLQYAVFTHGAAGDLYDKDRVSLRLHADEIILNRQTSDLLVRGHVEITSSTGDRLSAAEARWDNAAHLLVLSQGVSVMSGGNEAHASRVTLDTSRQTVDLEGDVDVRFPLRRLPP